jgi:purine-binding chemotaxis protein CheW
VDTAYILGMAKVDGGVKILLDIDMVLNGREIQEIEAAA